MAKDSNAGYHGSDRDIAARVKNALMCNILRRKCDQGEQLTAYLSGIGEAVMVATLFVLTLM